MQKHNKLSYSYIIKPLNLYIYSAMFVPMHLQNANSNPMWTQDFAGNRLMQVIWPMVWCILSGAGKRQSVINELAKGTSQRVISPSRIVAKCSKRSCWCFTPSWNSITLKPLEFETLFQAAFASPTSSFSMSLWAQLISTQAEKFSAWVKLSKHYVARFLWHQTNLSA